MGEEGSSLETVSFFLSSFSSSCIGSAAASASSLSLLLRPSSSKLTESACVYVREYEGGGVYARLPQERRGRGRGGEAYRPSPPPGAPQSPSRSLALKKAQLLRTVQGYNVHLLLPPRPPPTAQQLSPLFLLPPRSPPPPPPPPYYFPRGEGKTQRGLSLRLETLLLQRTFRRLFPSLALEPG